MYSAAKEALRREQQSAVPPELVEAVEATETFEARQKARQRIPSYLKHTRPYSANTLWTYYERTHHDPEGETCNYCSMFSGQTFTGDMLRSTFPDHYFEGDDIYPDIHKTLWGVEGTCACLLIREPTDVPELNLELWTSIGVDWKETPKTELEEYEEE